MQRVFAVVLWVSVSALAPFAAAQEVKPRTVAIQAGRLVDVINKRVLRD